MNVRSRLSLCFIFFLLINKVCIATTIDFQESTRIKPHDYLLKSYQGTDDIFDSMHVVDLSLDLGVGADCGRLDIRNTLKASLNNILDEKYLESMGRNILAASPMLLTCYLSPTWCSILKHSRIRASALLKTRLSQCGMIDKYIDSRAEEFQQDRQNCVRKEIDSSGGNFEVAMDSCQNIWNRNLPDWSSDNAPKKEVNRVIEASAKWAGATNTESKRIQNLLTSMVGETVVNKGNVSVEYGTGGKSSTPRVYLGELELKAHNKLCRDLIPALMASGGAGADINREVTAAQLKAVSLGGDEHLIDRQTLAALLILPSGQRRAACRKLSNSVAMTKFAADMNKTLDFMVSTVSHNPHLPQNRKKEAEVKRRALRDQIELTLTLNKHKTQSLNEVLFQVNSAANQKQDKRLQSAFSNDEAVHNNQKTENTLFDCSDGAFCP